LFVTINILYANNVQKSYNFGYINGSMSNYSKKDLKLTMDIWMKEVTKNLGDVNMIFYDDPRGAAKDIKDGKLDYISAFPIVFVKYFDIGLLSDGFTGGIKKQKLQKFVVLVRTKSNKNIEKLKNVKVGIQANDEIMEIYTKVNIKNAKIKKFKTRNRVVLDLFFSKIDVALVPLSTFVLTKELNPQIGKKIKILKITNFSSNILGFYRKDFNNKDKEFIFDTGIKVFNTVRGKQMMDIYKIEKLIHTKTDELNIEKMLYKKYKSIYKED